MAHSPSLLVHSLSLLVLAACAVDGTQPTAPTTLVPNTTESTESADPTTLGGTYYLFDFDAPWGGGQRCGGGGDFDDVTIGARVVVRDQSDDIVAVGSLVDSIARSTMGCEFTLVVENVPSDRPFYTVQIAQRGPVAYSLADLEAAGWTLELTGGR